MNVNIKVPTIGESISEATVSRIITPTGSVVAVDAEILELETDKLNQVLYAPKGGKITLTVKVGDTVKIGQVIGTVDTDVAAPAADIKKIEEPKAVSPGPSARKMAADFIRTPKKEEAPLQPSLGRRRMSSLRRTIAMRLVEVKNSTALNYTFNEVDMSKVVAIRSREKESFVAKYGVKLGFMSFFIKASVSALKAFPDIHSYIEGEDIVAFPEYNIGIAVSTDRGLVVPVLRRCDTASFGEIEKQLDQLATKARTGTLSIDDIRGGSFTITNGGVFGSLLSTAIPPPPESASLSMHAIVKRPVAIEESVVIRPMMYISLSYDHRIIDGREAIQFLVHIKEALEDPTRLIHEL